MKWIIALSLVWVSVGCGETDEAGAPLDSLDAEAPALDVEVDSGQSVEPDAAEPEPDAAPPEPDAAPPEPDAAPGDTWDSYARGFFATYCTACHAGGPRDYRTIEEVVRDQDTIRCGVGAVRGEGCGAWPPAGQFPVGNGPRPDGDERARLVAWIADGLQE